MLREATGQAVSLCAFINEEVIALELLQGRAIVEFGVKPGTKMDLHATAHGKIALAFGPPPIRQSRAGLPQVMDVLHHQEPAGPEEGDFGDPQERLGDGCQ
ncbi:hypothetical protein LP414_07350 [Polaromonas sp. P1(28)-13]|nr:hypothetical protein LP414_07350 [Polaromonas sp. P1(28)-13]